MGQSTLTGVGASTWTSSISSGLTSSGIESHLVVRVLISSCKMVLKVGGVIYARSEWSISFRISTSGSTAVPGYLSTKF